MADAGPANIRREHSHNRRLGKRLALIRSTKGLTLMEVARASGVNFATLQRYEAGARGVSFGRLVEIARALGEPVSALVSDFSEGEGAVDAADSGAVLKFARLASRLPRSKQNVLVAVAREMSR